MGREADLDVYDGQAWVAIQLDKAARYWEYVQAMVKAGKLALTPYLSQQLARFARKSASGLYTALPLDEWGIGPLRVQGGAYSVAAADAVARMEASGVALKQSVWDALDAAAAAEAKERSYR